MTLDTRYYLSMFIRRLPLFLAVSGAIAGLAIAAALTLPPAYVSQTTLIIESSQIPDGMAGPTVDIPPEEQLELFQTRLLTRANMLNIARKLNVLEGQASMSPDQIVAGMQSRTSIRRQAGRNQATVMSISFEARSPQIAAGVLNEYLTLILQQDAANRSERAGQTQDFFKQEVDRLSQELDASGAKILAFKNSNADALPDSLDYMRSQQLAMQDRIAQSDRELASLGEQRARLVQVFDATGRIDSTATPDLRSPDEIQLETLRRQLNDALLIYSPENPSVKLLQRRIDQLSAAVAAGSGGQPQREAVTDPAKAMLDLQLAEIDSRAKSLTEQKATDQARLDTLSENIARTPANAIALEAMQRDYDNLQEQYNTAVARLAQASTGERIELLSRGQKVSVIEQPSVPTEPTKPNRMRLAIAGVAAGLAAGGGLLVLLEMMNSTARRPADLVARMGIAPIATIPYLRTRREAAMRRLSQVAMALLVIVAIPAALIAIHVYYMPLDLIADRVMSKFGLRG